MYGNAFAARDVADNSFATDRVATARAVDQHIALAADGDGIVIPEDAAHHAGDAPGLRSQTLGFDIAGNGMGRPSMQLAGQQLVRGIFSAVDSRLEVVGLVQPISGGDLLQIFVFVFFQRDSVLARFFIYQLAPDINGALPL